MLFRSQLHPGVRPGQIPLRRFFQGGRAAHGFADGRADADDPLAVAVVKNDVRRRGAGRISGK